MLCWIDTWPSGEYGQTDLPEDEERKENEMRTRKAFYKSKGFWGPVIALFAMGVEMRGWGSVNQAALLGVVDQIVTWGGVLVGFWGRIAATEELAVKDGPDPDAPGNWRDGL